MRLIPLLLTVILCLAVPAHAADLRSTYEGATEAYNRGDFAKAVDLFTESTKMAPKFAPAYVGLGMALMSNGAEMEEVLYYYKTAVEVDPSNAPAFEQMGRLYYGINKFDKAEDAFLKALKIDPGMSSVKLSLGWLYLTAKPRPAKAMAYFQDVIKVAPTPNTYFGLGMAYFSNNDREKAMDIITKLRDMKQEDLAKKLETAMRENRKVSLEPPAEEPAPEVQALQEDQPSAAAPVPVQPVGIKARLRGKLDDLK